MIEFLKANWQTVAIVVAMVVVAVWGKIGPLVGGLFGGLFGGLKNLAPGIGFGTSENSRAAFVRARDAYREDLKALGLPNQLVDELVVEAATKAVSP